MANRFTRVPDCPPPTLSRLGRLALPLADLYCAIMLSRPASGTLATTWVTPASFLLSSLVFFLAIPAAFASAISLGLPPLLGLALALVWLLFALGALALALVGLSQHVQFHCDHAGQPSPRP